jgi:hypothetical protein
MELVFDVVTLFGGVVPGVVAAWSVAHIGTGCKSMPAELQTPKLYCRGRVIERKHCKFSGEMDTLKCFRVRSGSLEVCCRPIKSKVSKLAEEQLRKEYCMIA